MNDLTTLLHAVESGDVHAAEELLASVYQELRKAAASKMAGGIGGQTLQPTALVHEAWIRLGDPGKRRWQNRSHFFAAAAEAMRHILIDRARKRSRMRHGAGLERVDADDFPLAAPETDDRLLQIHEALDRLAQADPVKAEVVKLRFFVGCSEAEIAEALGISERSVERHWAFARAWLIRETQEANGHNR